mmetsp:Transcript_40548/g.85101  ORF Transcript_40548/g.85101 Transcript_40548/m.85101 type:complete len:229 (+) Transcript_40548:390-1076(+)
MLEFDAALNELLSLSSDSVLDDVLAAFPRLSNSANEASGGEWLLLGVQERWLDLLVGSSTFIRRLKEKDSPKTAEFTLFDILRPYLNNLEHVLSLDKGHATLERNLEALARIVDGVFKLLVQVREMKTQKRLGRRKKRKKAPDNNDSGVDTNDAGFVLVLETNKLIGTRSDCVWTAEQLWNIGNKVRILKTFSLKHYDDFLSQNILALISKTVDGNQFGSKGRERLCR